MTGDPMMLCDHKVQSNPASVQSKFLGGEGVVDGEGGSSEGCLKWGGGGVGSLRDLSKNVLKQGVGKGESCSKGEGGFEGVTTPPPRKIRISFCQPRNGL